MEELKLSIEEASEKLILSQSSLYNWMDKGKLKFEEDHRGRVIVITEEEANFIRDRNLKSKRIKNSNKFQETSNNFQEPLSSFQEFPDDFSSKFQEIPRVSTNIDYIEMLKTVAHYAEKAGRYELLEDKSKELKSDVTHWQEEYFKMKYERDLLQERYNKLQEDFENYKNKKALFLGMFRK